MVPTQKPSNFGRRRNHSAALARANDSPSHSLRTSQVLSEAQAVLRKGQVGVGTPIRILSNTKRIRAAASPNDLPDAASSLAPACEKPVGTSPSATGSQHGVSHESSWNPTSSVSISAEHGLHGFEFAELDRKLAQFEEWINIDEAFDGRMNQWVDKIYGNDTARTNRLRAPDSPQSVPGSLADVADLLDEPLPEVPPLTPEEIKKHNEQSEEDKLWGYKTPLKIIKMANIWRKNARNGHSDPEVMMKQIEEQQRIQHEQWQKREHKRLSGGSGKSSGQAQPTSPRKSPEKRTPAKSPNKQPTTLPYRQRTPGSSPMFQKPKGKKQTSPQKSMEDIMRMPSWRPAG